MPHSDDRKGTSPSATGRGRRDARPSAQRRPTTKRAGKDCLGLGTCKRRVSSDLGMTPLAKQTFQNLRIAFVSSAHAVKRIAIRSSNNH